MLISAIYSQNIFNTDEVSLVDIKKIITCSEWRNLILLDACRYDVFKQVVEKLNIFPKHKMQPAISYSSSTPEFVRKIILENKDIFRDVVYVSANPMVDSSLRSLGVNPEDVFYKYIPAWRIAWNRFYNTVLPEDLFLIALKTFIKYPSQKMVIHFIQPHFPYISDKYMHINKLVYSDIMQALKRGFLHRRGAINDDDTFVMFIRLAKLFLSCGALSSILSHDFCKYVKKRNEEILKAYVTNLLKVLPYAKRLSEILPGKTIITSDHGEALGEFIHKYIPIRLWGHISRIKIPCLILVPYIETFNNTPLHLSLKRALREYVKHTLRRR